MEQTAFMAYRHANHHPKKPYYLDTVGSVLHSVCETKGLTWKEAYRKLIEASGRLGLMPQDRKTVRDMLKTQGFYLQAGAYANRSVMSIIEECNRIFHAGEVVILNLSKNASSGTYMPIVPVGRGSGAHYVLQYPVDLRFSNAAEVWIAWQDGQDHSIMPRRKGTRTACVLENTTKDNEALFVYNENPNDNLIGDCAVRAVAGVFEISWCEAVRKLAEAQDYAATVINRVSNIEALLRKEGFQEFSAIKRNGQILTGKEFCDLIHDMFQAGTRIFAQVGNNHAVAILVFDEDYKIVDTWDSTNRKITKYWAKYPEVRPSERTIETEKPPKKLTKLATGMKIRHKAYGIGTIGDITSTIATVHFPNNVEKKLAISWILANCKPAE